MKESSIITSIKRKVAAIPNTKVKKLWSTAMNRDIDLLVVTNGLACFYEIKVPGERPTEWQTHRLDYWRDTGADVGWFDDADKCIERIKYMAVKGKAVQVFLQSHLY